MVLGRISTSASSVEVFQHLVLDVAQLSIYISSCAYVVFVWPHYLRALSLRGFSSIAIYDYLANCLAHFLGTHTPCYQKCNIAKILPSRVTVRFDSVSIFRRTIEKSSISNRIKFSITTSLLSITTSAILEEV